MSESSTTVYPYYYDTYVLGDPPQTTVYFPDFYERTITYGPSVWVVSSGDSSLLTVHTAYPYSLTHITPASGSNPTVAPTATGASVSSSTSAAASLSTPTAAGASASAATSPVPSAQSSSPNLAVIIPVILCAVLGLVLIVVVAILIHRRRKAKRAERAAATKPLFSKLGTHRMFSRRTRDHWTKNELDGDERWETEGEQRWEKDGEDAWEMKMRRAETRGARKELENGGQKYDRRDGGGTELPA